MFGVASSIDIRSFTCLSMLYSSARGRLPAPLACREKKTTVALPLDEIMSKQLNKRLLHRPPLITFFVTLNTKSNCTGYNSECHDKGHSDTQDVFPAPYSIVGGRSFIVRCQLNRRHVFPLLISAEGYF